MQNKKGEERRGKKTYVKTAISYVKFAILQMAKKCKKASNYLAFLRNRFFCKYMYVILS